MLSDSEGIDSDIYPLFNGVIHNAATSLRCRVNGNWSKIESDRARI